MSFWLPPSTLPMTRPRISMKSSRAPASTFPPTTPRVLIIMESSPTNADTFPSSVELILNVSFAAPPSRFWIFVNAVILPLRSPAFVCETVKLFPSSSPTSVLSPPAPSTVPMMLPRRLKLKVSGPAPPTSVSMSRNSLVFVTRVPLPIAERAPLPSILNRFPSSSPVNVSKPGPPISVPPIEPVGPKKN